MTFSRVYVPVAGGDLTVGVWQPAHYTQTLLAIHGVTSSHLAFQWLAAALPDVRIIAPDLRGRGGSNTLPGPTGMTAHAADMASVLDHFGLDAVPVVGHSMGAFVGIVFAHLHPVRVTSLLLVDGGLPLVVPPGLTPEQIVQAILGSTAERLATRWDSVEAYIDGFWRDHPSFQEDWSDALEAYIAYDLVPDGAQLRPATSYDLMVDDTVDLNTGSAILAGLDAITHPTTLVTVPRGLQNETPGLYPPANLATQLAQYPAVRHVGLENLNHYTVVMSDHGAAELAPLVRALSPAKPS